MKLNTVILISLAILCMNATRCSNPEGNTGVGVFGYDKLKLTPEWTNDMRVTYSTSGGMLDVYTQFEIYTDSASYTLHEDQVTNKYKLKFSKTELNAIAKILYDNNFSRLSPTEHAIIYDKGSKSISVFKGPEGLTKGDGATESYTGKDGEALSRIQAEVLTIVQNKLNQQKKAQVRIIFDPSLTLTKYNYRLQFAPTDNYFDTGSEGRLKETGFELLDGKYNLSVYTYKSVPNYGTKYGPNGNLLFSTLEVNTISIGLTKDSLISITPSKK
jgi:hypothetical protein